MYRDKDCMKKFCEFLREPAIKIVNFKKKKNRVINKRVAGIIWKFKNSLNCKVNIWKVKNIVKLEIIVIIQEDIGVLHITYVI